MRCFLIHHISKRAEFSALFIFLLNSPQGRILSERSKIRRNAKEHPIRHFAPPFAQPQTADPSVCFADSSPSGEPVLPRRNAKEHLIRHFVPPFAQPQTADPSVCCADISPNRGVSSRGRLFSFLRNIFRPNRTYILKMRKTVV